MKEIIVYTIAAIACLAILGYSIHMFVGGLVSAELERSIIIGATLVGAMIIGLLARDVIRTRKANLTKENNTH
jgi:hypothetical protein